MRELPTGTVTLLFTDIEGSTHLLHHLGERYPDMLDECRGLLRAAFHQHHGYEVDTQGDAFFVAFGRAIDAVSAAIAAQRALASHPWPEGAALRVRMGLHTGEPSVATEGYVGLDVHRAARIMSAGHGGQVLLSQTTRDLVEHALPEGAHLQDLGAHRLKDLQQPSHLFQLVIAGLPIDFPPLRTLDIQPNNLPVQPTPFLGREKEVAAVTALLCREDVRLVTLTGVGGTGKTRMALQVAAELSEAFPDGVFFVNLAPISDPALVIPTIAQVLDVKEMGEHSLLDLLQAFLREKHLLLLLDNFEQVVRAGVQVAELLAACPRLMVLVTSRMALHVRAEHEFAVPPLALPDLKRLPGLVALSQYEVVALFIQRAQAVKSDFQVTSASAPAVAEICVRLDGLPLAIELAAARMKLLTPEALLARLGQRLHLLTGGARDVAERQQTLRNTIAWSYQLLDSQEQRLFRRLSIFVGGCTLEAIEAIDAAPGDGAEWALDTVSSLVDKSLLQRMEQEAQEEPRFVMLETIREYGLELLAASGELEEVRKAHAAYFLALAEEAYLKTESLEQSAWLRRLDRDHDNLHAVMSWSLEHPGREREMALRLGIALQPFWDTRGYYSEGRDFLERALGGSDDKEDALRAGTLPTTHDGQMRWQGMMALGFLWTERDYAQAGVWFRRASDLAERLAAPTLRARSLNRIGNWHLNLEQPHEALRYHQQALTIFQELHDPRGIAETLDLLGMAHYLGGDVVQGTAYYQQAIALFQQLGDRQGLVSSLAQLTVACGSDLMGPTLLTLSLAESRHSGEQALKIAREIGQRSAEAFTLFNLALVLGSRGEYAQALEMAQEGLSIAEQIEHHQWLTYGYFDLGMLSLDLLDLPTAQQHLEQALALAHEIGSGYWIRLVSGLLALVYLVHQDVARAESILTAAPGPDVPPQTIGHWLVWYARAELAQAIGDPGLALEIVDQLSASTSNLSHRHRNPRLSKVRGEALATLGQGAEAEAELQAAQETARVQGLRPALWHICVALGKFYQTQARGAEAEQAFSTARALIEELAANVPDEHLREHFLVQATAMLPQKRALTPDRAARQAYGGLTAREREVAALIAQGKTNRAVAEQLVLSERTVEGHVTNILIKLGCTTRTQIATWAVEKGLARRDE